MQQKKISRRSFLNKAWIGLGAVAFAELILLVVTFFKPRQPRSAPQEKDTVIVAGAVDSFEPGSVTAFVRGKFYLARLENGGFLALSRTCTHLGCTVPWVSGENRFICPCHSSVFDINGDVVDPPAPRALDLFEINIENNLVNVDTAKRTKRAAFEPNQAVYPKQA